MLQWVANIIAYTKPDYHRLQS